MSSLTGVTLNRNLRAAWLTEALRLRAENVHSTDAIKRLDDLVAQDIHGVESRRKSLRYLRQVWLEPHPQLNSFQEEACGVFRNHPNESTGKVLSFFMLLAVYPFAREVAEVCGQLFRIQGSIKTEQIKRKVLAKYGDREPVIRSTRYAISIFSDLGMILPGQHRGTYDVGNQKFEGERIAAYALEAVFISTAKKELPRSDLDFHSALFSFDSHSLIALAISDRRFGLSRESMSREIIHYNQ